MIEFKNVSKTYHLNKAPFHALSEINLIIPDGSIIGILGKSGAGKSTLLRMINGLITPSQGEILVDSRVINSLSTKEQRAMRHTMGMVFQNFNLFQTKTVYQNIEIALQAIESPKQKRREKIEKVLEQVGLSAKIHSYPQQLSGGEKQRVGIARALVTNPKYLLCDEMTSALDPKTAKEILDLLQVIHQKYHLTIIFITHQIEAVMHLCHEVILMEHGKITHRSSTLDLFLHLDNPSTATYLKPIVYDVPIEHDHVYQLIYVGAVLQEESVLSHMIRHYSVDVNIIHAKILLIGKERLGYLYLQILGDNQDQAITYLKDQGIIVHAMENTRLMESHNHAN
ncbi:methionine ABC transporter ATP-binding protein [Entomospira entomophila]|uniref:Cell division ATP-binding protein FtsE n=1 Tax=Entomospira entomophila TaxID=2719988 RepID=A0A968KWM5_9SPIO|nr:methionine ABC transporter ATP-binding protein [Entomospira entomophilus]NIZ40950.1 methionine ABC transporter ATP-binding protein [Entomospira entomophilus]WDI35163.1 methionine ABC transporter ATP-binding protein [Entomospira entomophilus]